MKKTLLYIVAFVFTLSLSSCHAVWDMAVAPFVKYDMEESDIKWSKYFPDCDYISCKIDTSLYNSFLYDEQYCTNRWRLKYKTSASIIQTIMFDKNAQCVGGYELCYGNAKMLDVYEDVPIFQRNIYNDTIYEVVNFYNYVDLFDVDENNKDEIIKTLDNYDYNIVVVWTSYAAYYMKRHLRQVKKYIEEFGDEYKFRVVYLEI